MVKENKSLIFTKENVEPPHDLSYLFRHEVKTGLTRLTRLTRYFQERSHCDMIYHIPHHISIKCIILNDLLEKWKHPFRAALAIIPGTWEEIRKIENGVGKKYFPVIKKNNFLLEKSFRKVQYFRRIVLEKQFKTLKNHSCSAKSKLLFLFGNKAFHTFKTNTSNVWRRAEKKHTYLRFFLYIKRVYNVRSQVQYTESLAIRRTKCVSRNIRKFVW